MSEKVNLTVYKNSPHIWAGGLDGMELAKWLYARASAIKCAIEYKESALAIARESIICENEISMMNSYAHLSVSHRESDPILQVSKEAIEFDVQRASMLRSPFLGEQVTELYPSGYSHLPDLSKAREEYLQKKGLQFAEASNRFGQKVDDSER